MCKAMSAYGRYAFGLLIVCTILNKNILFKNCFIIIITSNIANTFSKNVDAMHLPF